MKWRSSIWGLSTTPHSFCAGARISLCLICFQMFEVRESHHPNHGQRLTQHFQGSWLWHWFNPNHPCPGPDVYSRVYWGECGFCVKHIPVWHHRSLEGTSCTLSCGARGIISDDGIREVVTMAHANGPLDPIAWCCIGTLAHRGRRGWKSRLYAKQNNMTT